MMELARFALDIFIHGVMAKEGDRGTDGEKD